MPSYPFTCPACGRYTEEVRPMSMSGDVCLCTCGQPMNRVWLPPQVDIPMSGYFNNGLGIWVNSRQDVANELKRLRDGYTVDVETRDRKTHRVLRRKKEIPGREVVEVGNEKPTARDNHKPYVLPRGVLDGYGLD